MEWISVNDELPQDRQPVLFYNAGYIEKAVFLERYINEYSSLENVFVTSNAGLFRLDCKMASHWMRLPDPPKTNKNG